MPVARNGTIIPIDDQPISAGFFGEGQWLTDFVTPNALEVKTLYKDICKGKQTRRERVVGMHQFVGAAIKYRPFIGATMTVAGKTSRNPDAWLPPSITRMVGIGNCANKAFLLASLLRNEFSPKEVHVVLGNLYNGKAGGHAWCQLQMDDRSYIIESTRADVPTFISTDTTERYEAVHFFNDIDAYAIAGRTAMEPYLACYSTWLKDYLDMSYIRGKK